VGWVRVEQGKEEEAEEGGRSGTGDRGRVAFASLRVVHPGAPAHPLNNLTAILPSARAVVLRFSVLSPRSAVFLFVLFFYFLVVVIVLVIIVIIDDGTYTLSNATPVKHCVLARHRIKGVRAVSIGNVCGASLAASYRTMTSIRV